MGFLLPVPVVDAKNAFNMQHEWASGPQFYFNHCYKCCETLLIRRQDGVSLFLFSKEGVSQGGPLSMFIYGMGILPSIHHLKSEIEDAMHPFCEIKNNPLYYELDVAIYQ
eukprot:scaffold153556_cov45-Attheya_sp.AAC.1